MSSTRLFLLQCLLTNDRLVPCSDGLESRPRRDGSPSGGGSTLRPSAPWSARYVAVVGPAIPRARSTTRMPSSASAIVASLSRMLSRTARYLADQGAEVIKVEPPPEGPVS